MATIGDKNREGLRNITLAAFVKDGESEAELSQYLKTGTLTDTRVARGGIEDAIAWLQRVGRSPQRLLVDITGSSSPLDELDHLANACEPSVQVYVVGDRNDVGLYRNLLLRGVQDYLVKPLNAELLRRALDESSNSAIRKGRYGKAIAMVGTRGGVGVTSIAANLARELAAGGALRRVVYLDVDPYAGSGASALGLAGGQALIDVMTNVNRLDQQYLERTLTTSDSKLYALTAELPFGDEFLPAPGVLGTVIDTLCQHFHYVVVDLPTGGGLLSNEAFSHASLACVVSDLSVHSARNMLRLARHIEARPNAPTVYSVLNHTQPPVKGRVHIKDFIDAVQKPVQIQIRYDASRLALAENLGEPLPNKGEFLDGVKALAALVTGQTQKPVRNSWLSGWLTARRSAA